MNAGSIHSSSLQWQDADRTLQQQSPPFRSHQCPLLPASTQALEMAVVRAGAAPAVLQRGRGRRVRRQVE